MTARLPTEAIREILAWLHRSQPRSLLLVCPGDSPLKDAVEHVGVAEHLLHIEPEADWREALGQRTFDLAVVADTLERLPTRTAGHLLGRLRDLHTRRFLALVRLGGDWRNTDMIAYGLKRCALFRDGDAYGLYRFNIYDYKDTPDWLNARYWAHPERWGKERW